MKRLLLLSILILALLAGCVPEEQWPEDVYISDIHGDNAYFDSLTVDDMPITYTPEPEYEPLSVIWLGTTTDNSPTEIFLPDQTRYAIKESSAISFDILVIARDNTADEVARYSFQGLIKRDGADNTTLVWSSSNADYEDDNTWDCAISNDDVNESLKITVTGDAVNIVRWSAILWGTEVYF